jgi:hypothetical protein
MLGIAVSLFSPPDTLWRMAAYYLQPPIAREMFSAAPFSSAIVPSALMVWWAGGFTLAVLALALVSFNRRQL